MHNRQLTRVKDLAEEFNMSIKQMDEKLKEFFKIGILQKFFPPAKTVGEKEYTINYKFFDLPFTELIGVE
jgi:hypothetical protein